MKIIAYFSCAMGLFFLTACNKDQESGDPAGETGSEKTLNALRNENQTLKEEIKAKDEKFDKVNQQLDALNAEVGRLKAFPPSNIALGKRVKQSSTYGGEGAEKAIDNNTSGDAPAFRSITHTNSEASAWWEVDLGKEYTLDSIIIWNRTDCCQDRLSNFYVMLSSTPFQSDTYDQEKIVAHIQSYPNPSKIISLNNKKGRYVRIELVGTNYLSLAEVQLMARPQ